MTHHTLHNKYLDHDFRVEIYRNRDYALSSVARSVLDEQGFDNLWFTGCLDAPEQIPAGSHKKYGGSGMHVLISRHEMTITVEEKKRRDAILERLMKEILDESK